MSLGVSSSSSSSLPALPTLPPTSSFSYSTTINSTIKPPPKQLTLPPNPTANPTANQNDEPYDPSLFPDPLASTAAMPLWGLALSNERKRSRKTQPSLKSHTGYTTSHYKPQNDLRVRQDRMTEKMALTLAETTDPNDPNSLAIPTLPNNPNNDPMVGKQKWRSLQYLYNTIIQPAYRSGSVENAMWSLSNKHISKHVFVQSIISEFKFDRRLRMEEHLEKLYDSFPNASSNKVDMRVILCSYLVLVLFKTIQENPRHLFFLLYDIFSPPFSDTIFRSDLLTVLSLCSITETEKTETSDKMDAALTDLSSMYGLKSDFRVVEKKHVFEVFEIHPGILISFKNQCWARLSDDQRLYILNKKEEESALGFEYQDYKFKARQALQLWKKAILAKSFRSWEEYKTESLRIKGQRLWMLYRSAKRRIAQWRLRTELNLAKRERIKIARAMGKLIIKRARFLRWARLVITQRKILRGCARFDDKFKRYGDGLGHLRYAWYRWSARLMLQRWDDETKYMARVQYATKWATAKFKERNWKAFKVYIRQCIIEKNKELDAVDRRDWITNMMKEADAELKDLKKKKEEEMLRKEIEREEEEARERIRNKNQMLQRKKAERGANDRLLRELQREERRRRVEGEKQAIFEAWNEEWNGSNPNRHTFNPNRTKYRKKHEDTPEDQCYRCGRNGHHYKMCYYNEHVNGVHVYSKGETLEDLSDKYKVSVSDLCRLNHIETHKDLKNGQNVCVKDINDGNWHAKMHKEPGENWTWDMVQVCRNRVAKWMKSKEVDAKEKLAKAFKNLRRDFYTPPTIENVFRETQLNSEANIALSIIDGKLFSRGILGRELFERFDESGDGYITYDEFLNGIESMDLKIEHSWIRSIVKSIDTEGDGYISVEELTAAMDRTYQYNGVRGSPWKMYVSIAHQILCFHDVVNDVIIFEHEMKDKKLKEIVRANFLAEAEFKERDIILDMKRKDLKDRREHYAACKLQFFYWKWTALRDMAKQRWKLEQHELSLMRKKERKFALMWQSAYRKRMARNATWFRVQMHYQKMVIFDQGHMDAPRMCYYNHLTGDQTWDKPKIFFMFLGMEGVNDLDEPLPWSIQYDANGNQYWLNHIEGTKIEGETHWGMMDGVNQVLGYSPPSKPPGYPICLSCNIELAWRACKQCEFSYCFQCFRVNHNFLGAEKHKWTIVEPLTCSLCIKNVAAKKAKGKLFCQSCFGRLEKSGVFRGKAVGKIEDV